MSSRPHEVPPPPAGGTPQLGGSTAVAAPTNNLAVVSFVASLASFFAHVVPGAGFIVAVVAIVTGFMARGQIKRTGEQGMWMANAGIIIGFVHVALGLIVVLLVLFLIFVVGLALFGIAASGAGSSPSPVPSG